MSLYIRDRAALSALVEQLRGAPRLALDTEFVRDTQYYPQLEIIQIATPDVAAIIDYRALGTLEPFTELLADPRTLKVFHAGSQDMEIFFNLTGRVPAPLFDTQVAAAMVGMGAQIGYSRLVEGVTGVTLHKRETLTDWTRRPLTEAQIEYALDDVRYLLPIHDRLVAELDRMGRAEWLEAEWREMERPESYERIAPRLAYRRVQGSNRLRPREMAVLRELAEWREREGMRRNRAPSLIVRDDILVDLARRGPTTLAALRETRGLHERELGRSGKELLETIERGQALPRSEWPKAPERAALSEQETSLVTLLQSWLRSRADELAIAPSFLATAAELRELVGAAPEERASQPLMHGWRRRLVGDDLAALLGGTASLAWSPDGQRLVLRRDGEP